MVYLAGYYATRDNFVYIQVIFGLFNGMGTGTGQLICYSAHISAFKNVNFQAGHVVMWSVNNGWTRNELN